MRIHPFLVAVLILMGAPASLHGDPVADFELEDVNTSSPRFTQVVSPRNYLHQVSAYYFGAST